MPLVILSTIPTLVHVGIAYGFVEWKSLNFIGGPIATSIPLWIPHDSKHRLMESCMFTYYVQGVLSGVTTGCGWQHLAIYVNLATFYLIDLPISCLLGFKTNLQFKGL
ncbi:hypothetical protein P8452_52796 [Trifolium repens]|nr:hypothetical protein P8452_52796 [Trifolium repens]